MPVKQQIPHLQGVQILEEAIKYRWGALPDQQRQGIRNYISNLIIKLSSDEAVFRQEKVFLNKLNIILVQVIPLDPCLGLRRWGMRPPNWAPGFEREVTMVWPVTSDRSCWITFCRGHMLHRCELSV